MTGAPLVTLIIFSTSNYPFFKVQNSFSAQVPLQCEGKFFLFLPSMYTGLKYWSSHGWKFTQGSNAWLQAHPTVAGLDDKPNFLGDDGLVGFLGDSRAFLFLVTAAEGVLGECLLGLDGCCLLHRLL
jgi:hypothetical protein